jgi:hypothetical protein
MRGIGLQRNPSSFDPRGLGLDDDEMKRLIQEAQRAGRTDPSGDRWLDWLDEMEIDDDEQLKEFLFEYYDKGGREGLYQGWVDQQTGGKDGMPTLIPPTRKQDEGFE